MEDQSWLAPKEPIWLHKNETFYKAVIKQIYKDTVTCLLENGDIIKSKRLDVFRRNPMPVDTSRTDLMETDIINQPEILNSLKSRFLEYKIYTFVENSLIVVNPYRLIPGLYTEEIKKFYIKTIIFNNENIKDHQPHLYATTAAMIAALKTEQNSQAIIISGESGAGKTQANKQCLRFLGQYFKGAHQNRQSQTEKTILLSNPILQAFGNSKTIRNNNSSRFGKYLRIMIDQNNMIRHAQIYNYLLQKSRIISRPPQQQNFHIFYEYLSKTTKAQKIKYNLLNEDNKEMTFQSFNYTKNDRIQSPLCHADVSFEKVKESLVILPNKNSYDYVCRILSAVLHLGNLEPYEDESLDRCQIVPQSSYISICKLLEIDAKFLQQALTSYSIKIGTDDLIKSFSKREVQELIRSLSKTLYEKLFQWIINEINRSTASESKEQLLSLGFLDIYGFQVLKINSLQQLFINYTNERLHQLYLQKIFKLQRQYFVAEKLEHMFVNINFQDNLKVIQLLDYDRLSVFNLLDEWCSVASPDESTFITKIRYNHKKHEKFPQANLNLLSTQFMILHTPQNVQYSVVGFREKNKDLLREQIKLTMKSSKLSILQQMFEEPKVNINQSVDHRVRKFLSSKFRKEMNTLTNEILSKCNLHFIRCIKSNSKKQPIMMQDEVAYSQIKYLGILDTIKIKKMGYSVKQKYETIDRRFCWLVRDNFTQPAFSSQIKKALTEFLPKFDQSYMLFGISKVFFRDSAYTFFLRKYSNYVDYLNQMTHRITSLLVHNAYMKKKQRKIKNMKIIRKYLDSFIEVRNYKRKFDKLIMVQRAIKAYLKNKAGLKKKESIEILQAYIRRHLEVKQRILKIESVQKIIRFFRRAMIRRKAQKRIFIGKLINKTIFEGAWKQIHDARFTVVERYMLSFYIQMKGKHKISEANLNQRIIVKQKRMKQIEIYLSTFKRVVLHKKFMRTVVVGQNLIRSWIIRRRYVKLRKAAIFIQRAFRKIMFKKQGAKSMFNKLYKFYYDDLAEQNKRIQSQLYDTQTTLAEQYSGMIKEFLGKFKEKISLLYMIIDFQSQVDLQIVYPHNSWIENYMQIYRESLEKDNPIQYLQTGQTFTVVANTNKTYLWGMYEQYNVNTHGIVQLKSNSPIEYFQIVNNQLVLHYHANEMKNFRISSTIAKDYNLDNAKLYECLSNELKLLPVGKNQRVLEISCGRAHTILRTSSKKVYTLGSGKNGQLGHSTLASQQEPRLVKFFESIKTAYPAQVSASFNCSIVLMSNRKIYWFGTNSTITRQTTPDLLQLKSKCSVFSSQQFTPVRLITSWSRTLSIIGVTVMCYNGKFHNNSALKTKTTDILMNKWQEAGLQHINPPFVTAVCDHIEQCHVRLPKRKVEIESQGHKTWKQIEHKVKGMGQSKPNQISFANTQRNSFFK